MNKKLSYPYRYYWQEFSKGKCPFCTADLIATTENKDIVFCNEYDKGGYLTSQACESYRSGNGRCRECSPKDDAIDKFSFVKEAGFLCEDCHHGVIFYETPIMITDIFLHTDDKNCPHCKKHNERVEREEKKEASKPEDISKFL